MLLRDVTNGVMHFIATEFCDGNDLSSHVISLPAVPSDIIVQCIESINPNGSWDTEHLKAIWLYLLCAAGGDTGIGGDQSSLSPEALGRIIEALPIFPVMGGKGSRR